MMYRSKKLCELSEVGSLLTTFKLSQAVLTKFAKKWHNSERRYTVYGYYEHLTARKFEGVH